MNHIARLYQSFNAYNTIFNSVLLFNARMPYKVKRGTILVLTYRILE